MISRLSVCWLPFLFKVILEVTSDSTALKQFNRPWLNFISPVREKWDNT